MQTFMPVPDFVLSAQILDNRRLGKQRVEAFQISRALQDPTYGWQHHPAVRMWRGYLPALLAYYNAVVAEWVSRGFQNSMPRLDPGQITLPAWFGDEAFHASHRSNLLRKDPIWYGRYGWKESPDLLYKWPL